MLDEDEFLARAARAGIEGRMAQFLFDNLAQTGHEHTSDEIITDSETNETLDNLLDAIVEDITELEGEEEEQEEEVED
jgi:hypothetical protein